RNLLARLRAAQLQESLNQPLQVVPSSAPRAGWFRHTGFWVAACGLLLISGFGLWSAHEDGAASRSAEERAAALERDLRDARNRMASAESSQSGLINELRAAKDQASDLSGRQERESSALSALERVRQGDVAALNELNEKLRDLSES